MDDGAGPATDSWGFWRRLQAAGSVEDAGRDSELESLLCDQLGLDDLSEESLRDVSVEEFVLAFFGVAQPYVAMWSELLAFFETANASSGSQQLEAVFDFAGDREALNFDLEHFRKLVETASAAVMPFDLRSKSAVDLWNVRIRPEDVDQSVKFHTDEGVDASTERFLMELASGEYPTRMPPRPRFDAPELDQLIGEIWELGTVVLHDFRALFRHRSLARAEPAQGDLTVAPSGLPRQPALWLSSDFWHRSIVREAIHAVGLPAADQRHIASNLEGNLASLRNGDPSLTTLNQRLVELLSLPLWKLRYDLYSSWVATRVAQAFVDKPVRLHSSNGRLVFSFSGTHLGTVDIEPRVHIWSELKTELANPVGTGRVGAIQPDLVLRSDPLTAGIFPLVVESKQYQKPAYESFGHAITDYARGHPDAMVILVNYGPGETSTLLTHVDEGVHDRARFVSRMRPDDAVALERFRLLVREAVKVHEPTGAGEARVAPVEDRADAPSTAEIDPEDLCLIELRWGASPKDLDLHILIDGDAVREISYSDRGTLAEAPYAWLENDDTSGFGNERLRIRKWLATTYRVTVVNYSREEAIQAGHVRVRVLLRDDEIVFTGPPQDEPEAWHVCTIDGTRQTVTPAGEE
jgi:hypothetical protein